MNYTYTSEVQYFDAANVRSADLVLYFSMHQSAAANIFSDGKMIGWLSQQNFLQNQCVYQPELLHSNWLSSNTDYITMHQRLIAFWKQYPKVHTIAVGASEQIEGQFIKTGMHRYSFETRKKLDALHLLRYYESELQQFFRYRHLEKVGIVVPREYENLVPNCFTVCNLEETAQYDLVAECCLLESFRPYFPTLIPIDELLACALLLELSKHPALMAHLYFIDEPIIDCSALYPDEAEMLSCVNNLGHALENIAFMDKVYDGYPEDRTYVEHLGKDVYHTVIISSNGVYRYILNAKLHGEFDGCRITPSNQGHPNHIYCYGPCITYSIFTSRYSTIEEFWQQKLNQSQIPFDVKNRGIPNGVNFLNDLLLFIYSDYAPVSYHVFINRFGNLIGDFLQEIGANYSTLTSAFQNCHYWFFNENVHLTPKGTKLVAKVLSKQIVLDSAYCTPHPNYLRRKQPDANYYLTEHGIDHYQQNLRRLATDAHGRVGFLHIIANPMTNSHAELIDTAAARCDTLYVFVVEDCINALPFYDRIQTVQEYCQKYTHVKVLSGSYFIGSRYTMTAYFNKQYDMEFVPDAEVENFSKLIMPILQIDEIFMFSDLNSPEKKRLHDAFDAYLKQYSKSLTEVPRRIYHNAPVTSARVRAMLKAGDYENIRETVPLNVFRYLQNLSPEEIAEF